VSCEVNSPLPALPLKPLTGAEPLHINRTPVGTEVLDFWRWAVSDLAGNNLRGHLAEFIVAKALGLPTVVRAEWDECDLVTEEGIRVEVKSAAYIQTWAQKELSKISFGIARAYGWDTDANERRTQAARNSDVYVFCLQHHRDQNTFDILDLSQWTFLVLSTAELNEKVGSQNTISLGSLKRLGPKECAYPDLPDALRRAVD
jgi:hypothetical protein